MPQKGSNTYVLPTNDDRTSFTILVNELLAENYAGIPDLAVSFGYKITYFTDDGDHDEKSFLLEEQTPIQRGWGWYAFRKNPTSNVIIEAPHPLADANTANVALDVYRGINARALLIAGAHRDANDNGSADVSHTAGSVFQIVHNSLVEHPIALQSTMIVLQIHGFGSTKHPKYPNIVIGYDPKAAIDLTAKVPSLKDALEVAGLQVGVCDGKSWEALCGTTDVISTIPNGLVIHLELNETIRSNDNDFIRAIIRAFAIPLH